MQRFIFGLAVASFALAGTAMAVADDAAITKQIAAKLREQQRQSNLKGFDIGIQVDDGTVTVGGRVSSEEQGHLALDIARRVPGVKMVVNDLRVGTGSASKSARTARRPLTAALTGLTAAVKRPAAGQDRPSRAVNQLTSLITSGGEAIGSGARNAAPALAAQPTPAGAPLAVARPTASYPAAARQAPLAFAPSTMNASLASAYGQLPGDAMSEGAPVPAHLPTGAPSGIARAAYDHPSLPGYAWPSYASYPNYGALTYPQQHSAAAWPYIGPFYPYPQVPLGWRKVMLEWDDGWWFLDFKAK